MPRLNAKGSLCYVTEMKQEDGAYIETLSCGHTQFAAPYAAKRVRSGERFAPPLVRTGSAGPARAASLHTGVCTMNTAIISHPSGARLEAFSDEDGHYTVYDVIRDGRHVGTITDTSDEGTGERYTCRVHDTGVWSHGPLRMWGTSRSGSGMVATRRTLDDAVSFILERTP